MSVRAPSTVGHGCWVQKTLSHISTLLNALAQKTLGKELDTRQRAEFPKAISLLVDLTSYNLQHNRANKRDVLALVKIHDVVLHKLCLQVSGG
jgi:hypothetical protein